MTSKDNVTERIASQGANNVFAGLLALAGFGLTVGLTVVDRSLDHTVRVGTGGVLFFPALSGILSHGTAATGQWTSERHSSTERQSVLRSFGNRRVP